MSLDFKKIKSTFLFFVGLGIITQFFSCETQFIAPVEDHEPKIVANFLISNEGLGSFTLSSTLSIDDTDWFQFLQDGDVSIYSNDKLISNFVSDDFNAERHDIIDKISPGDFIDIEVFSPFFPPVYAYDLMPEPVEITDLSITYDVEITEIELDIIEADVITVKFDDVPYENNYYHVRAYIQEERIGDPVKVYIPFRTINPAVPILFRDYGGQFPELLLTDESFENGSLEIEIYTESQNLDTFNADEVIVEVRNVSESYYNYYTSLVLNFKGESLLNYNVIDPVEIYNNIENGFGVFAAYYVDKKAIQIQ